MSKICQNCGHENRDVAIFCGNCGTRLIAQNLASNLTGSGNDGSSASTDNAGAGLCCAVLIILFIILLIMSGG